MAKRPQRANPRLRKSRKLTHPLLHLGVLLLLLPVVVVLTLRSTDFRQHAQAVEKPDIILITTDDMRTDDWRILSEAERLIGGTWFTNFVYSTPLCCPTRATIHSGLYAHNHGVTDNKPGWPNFRQHEPRSLAVALDSAGYHTVLLGKYMNGYDGTTVPPGWDVWRTDGGGGEDKYQMKEGYHTDVMRKWALEEIAKVGTEPLFLSVNFRAPHGPATPASRHKNIDVGTTRNKLDKKRKRTLLAVDEAVVAIAEAMGPRWDNACVFMLSDNGYLLGEHKTTGKSHWWDEASRVPLLARCEGLGSGTDERMASTVDLMPTILRAGGSQVDWELDGHPLQDGVQRESVLIESWARESDGNRRTPFTALKGPDWVYVEAQGKPPAYYKRPGENTDQIGTLTQTELDHLKTLLAELRNCRSTTCN